MIKVLMILYSVTGITSTVTDVDTCLSIKESVESQVHSTYPSNNLTKVDCIRLDGTFI